MEQLVATFIEAGVPVLLWGPPGVGKTARIRALADRMGRHLETVILSIREPTELCGLPFVTDGEVRFLPPAWARRLAEADRPGILFLDELTTCPPSVQAAALRVVLDRVVGELQLPPETTVIAAANPPELLAAGGWDLSPPLANRFAHIEVSETGFLPWLRGREIGFEVPAYSQAAFERELSFLKAELAAFLAVRGELICQPKGGRAWPSPRSWEFALRALAVARAARLRNIQLDVLAACVGPGAASEFYSHLKSALPDPEEVLSRAAEFPVDRTRLDVVQRLNEAVADAVIAEPTKERWAAAWVWFARQIELGIGDAAIPAVKRLSTELYDRIDRLGLPDAIGEFLQLVADISGGGQ